MLLTGDGHAWLWSPDGHSRPAITVGDDGWAALAPAGTLLWTPFQSLAATGGALVTDDGEQVAVDGTLAELTVDDGSAHGVVLLRTGPGGDTVVAHDAGSGKELWQASGTVGPLLVLDGAVVSAGSSSVTARDARTGDLRWRTTLGAAPVYLGADPLHVVVLTDDRALRTLDLGDGRVAVTDHVGSAFGAATADLDSAQEYGGRLLVTFRDGSVSALG